MSKNIFPFKKANKFQFFLAIFQQFFPFFMLVFRIFFKNKCTFFTKNGSTIFFKQCRPLFFKTIFIIISLHFLGDIFYHHLLKLLASPSKKFSTPSKSGTLKSQLTKRPTSQRTSHTFYQICLFTALH